MTAEECEHRERHDVYVEDHTDTWGDEIEGEWEYGYRNTFQDVDLHHYKCTLCGVVFHY